MVYRFGHRHSDECHSFAGFRVYHWRSGSGEAKRGESVRKANARIRKEVDLNHISFHIPGHKGRMLFEQKSMLEFDLTELPGLDNLLAPSGWIRELEHRIASYYGSLDSRILTGGSTLGILSSILGTIRYLEEDPEFCGRSSSAVPVVICEPNAHMSVRNAAVIGGATTLIRERDRLNEMVVQQKSSGLLLPVCRIIYVITRPTYEGELFELSGLIAKIKRQNPRAVVIVDEAHGAHLALESKWRAFRNGAPDLAELDMEEIQKLNQKVSQNSMYEQALECGADIVVQSFHKTLPALGTAAVLHYGKTPMGRSLLEHAPKEKSIEWYVCSLQTSSPSYLVLESIRQMMDVLEERGIALYERMVRNIERFYLETKVPKYVRTNGVQDIGKLLVPSQNLGHYEERGIHCEMKSGDFLLFMASIASTDTDFDALIEAVNADTSRECPKSSVKAGVFLIRRGDYRAEDSDTVCTGSDALGKKSAETLVLYPPGNVLINRGEVVTEAVVRKLEESGLKNIKLRTMV